MRSLTAAALLALALVGAADAQTARQDPAQYISVRTGETCDRSQNYKVFLRNRHNARGIEVTIRWRVYNGSFTTTRFRISAGAEQQVGCASSVNVVSASFITPDSPNEPPARNFIGLRAGNTCDQFQTRLVFLANKHGSRNINVTVRWRVVGGAFTTATFRINAREERQIGCAADASITAASYLP